MDFVLNDLKENGVSDSVTVVDMIEWKKKNRWDHPVSPDDFMQVENVYRIMVLGSWHTTKIIEKPRPFLKLPKLPGPRYHVWTVPETPADI